MPRGVSSSDVHQGSVPGRKQEVLLPEVRYHPSIQTAGTRPKSSRTRNSGTRRTGPGAAGPLQTRSHHAEDGAQVIQITQTPDTRLDHKPVPTASTDPDLMGDGARPRPEAVPLGLEVKMDRALAEQVEVLTRGQRENQAWFSWRRNRITASVAHRIAQSRFAKGQSQTPPSSYLRAITGEAPRVQTRAMSWGIRQEPVAIRRYQEMKSEALGRPVTVQDCGLFVDPCRPWLAASPDGLVLDRQTKRRLLCLEVKCPFKHRDRRVEDACRTDANFCLEIDGQAEHPAGAGPVYRLKTSHSYFTQIQCSLAVTGLKDADLVVFTLKETAIVPVTFDPVRWEETVSKLEVFYRDAVLPHLRQTGMRHERAAVLRSEQ